MPLEHKPTRVYVYRDAGVGSFSYRELLGSLIDLVGSSYSVDPITAAQLADGQWRKEAALVAFPGGRDLPYVQSCSGSANAHLRRFVEEGGSYLGICAGGYYGSSEVVFAKDSPLEIVGERELKFYPGKAVGPLYDAGAFSYDSEAGAKPAQLAVGDLQLHAYYNGGCAFHAPEAFADDVSVVGRYQDSHSQAAMVSCRVGRGMAMLFGVHLEYRARFLSKLNVTDEMRALLSASETVRQSVFNQLVGYLISRRACVG